MLANFGINFISFCKIPPPIKIPVPISSISDGALSINLENVSGSIPVFIVFITDLTDSLFMSFNSTNVSKTAG